MSRPWSPASALPLRVLVVDQASRCREDLIRRLNASPGMHVVAVARDTGEALAAAQRHEPQLVLISLQLPGQTSHAIAGELMASCPTRVIMLAPPAIPADSPLAREALTAGALLVLPHPTLTAHAGADFGDFLHTLRLMAEVHVVRRWRHLAARPAPGSQPTARPAPALVAIGASTGGPPVLQTILATLPPELPVPIVIVQHLATGFIDSFCTWLSTSTRQRVQVACHNEALRPGVVYLAPDDIQLAVSAEPRVLLRADPPEHGLRPSVSYLFRSVAQHVGHRAIGVLLTGMGRDGAQELAAMRQAGAITIAQDAASAAVNGMPGAAVQLQAAHHVLPPAEIAAVLRQLLRPS